jgi:hypothetical protein
VGTLTFGGIVLLFYAIQHGNVRVKCRFGDSHVWLETAICDAFNLVWMYSEKLGDEDMTA